MEDKQRWMIEDIILGMADIVEENRYLRCENERLQKVEKQYHQSIIDRCRASEEASFNMLRAACVGIAMGKDDRELARELVDYMHEE